MPRFVLGATQTVGFRQYRRLDDTTDPLDNEKSILVLNRDGTYPQLIADTLNRALVPNAPPPQTTVLVPDLANVLEATALSRVSAAGLTMRVVLTANPVIEKGRVISQAPPANTTVDARTEVVVTVSTGPAVVVTPPPMPPPISDSALLDNFSGPLRIGTTEGQALWQHYTEGASGSVASGSGVLKETVGPSNGRVNSGGAYLQFMPKSNNSYAFPNGYAQHFLINGVWRPTFNRLSFFMRVPKTLMRNSNGASWIEVGTYIRAHNDADPQNQGRHFYHQLNPSMYAGEWMLVILNGQPQHEVGITASTPKPNARYFDDLTRFYIDDANRRLVNSVVEYKDFRFSEVQGQPDAEVSSITVTYNGSAYEVSFAAVARRVLGYDVRLHTAPFNGDFGLGVAGGSVKSTGDDYQGVTWTSPARPKTTAPLYVAIRPSGVSTFTEIAIPQG